MNYTYFFSIWGRQTEKTPAYTHSFRGKDILIENSFFQSKEAKRRKPFVIQISAGKPSNQNWGYFFFGLKDGKARNSRHLHILSFNLRIQNRRNHVVAESLPSIQGNQIEGLMKSSNSFSCIKGNKSNETMSCAFSFLQSKEPKRNKSLVIHFFCPQGTKTERKPWITHTSFFSVRKQNRGRDVLSKFLSSI